MSKRYQVLARKYRPQAFRDVVGQQSAVTTLKNAIRFDKIAHAYLFCGSRGVGKTTLARLFAKALNCQSPTPELEPCNQCSSCLEISSGQSLDVIEIDGASNRGIDDIRQINETVGYAPSHGRYKIYIIDEVHMLTKEAFNALLKTLEEPPEQVKFFFATTEAHKVLPTIISRCQRFDLARIQPTLIAAKLQEIATDLGRTVEAEALELVASFAEGSLRDAESLFDQILCFAEETITGSIVRQSLGLVSQELFFNLDKAFSEYQLSYAFELVDQLFQTGKDLAHFLEQLIEHYRNITLARTVGSPHPSAKLYTQQQALHIFDLLIQAEAAFQKSPYPRITLESILLQIIRSKHRVPIEVLTRRIMEGKVEGRSQQEEVKEEVVVAAPPPAIKAEVKEEVVAAPPPAVKEETVVAPIVKQEEKIVLPPEPVRAEKPVEVVPQPPAEEKTPVLKPVPFNPYQAKKEAVSEVKPSPKTPSPLPERHPSHYDTLIRFAAVELEGTVKN